ncbi:cation-translocating P-type ATPase [Massilia sp. DWR3-1-1]|uniref:cation-translocating P-type ATPase n=1 Tax=Massilia sp. DWR3-1-1 TaxID=2804559 RepID=UPI003CF88F52
MQSNNQQTATAKPDAAQADSGLSDNEAARRLLRDGPNALDEAPRHAVLRQLLRVVSEPMFLLLVACGLVYLLLGDRGEALMLLCFVFLVMGMTFFQQRRTQNALASLREMASPSAQVVRSGAVRTMAARDLVCGDIVFVAEGTRVPADLLLLESSNVTTDESMLTGESVPVAKFAAAADVELASSQVFAGTLLTQGNARGRVIATGPRSALGRIGASLAAIDTGPTPIEQETRRVVLRVALAGLLLASLLALLYWYLRGDWLHGLLTGLTFAMAVLPEELPVVLTIFLGLGAWRLSRDQVLARRIPAIELLGATTLLCVDKTGTLTTNRMAVRALWSEAASVEIAGGAGAPLPEALHGVLEFAMLASHRRAFDPMESAIGAAGAALLAGTEHLHGDWTLLCDYPLSKQMLAMSRVWQAPDLREKMIAVKGAPEAVVDLCHLDAARAARIAGQVEHMAAQGLRVLGVGSAVFADSALPDRQHDFDFTFLGLIALADPVRQEVPAAIAQCRQAGIRVVMITGDHPATALSIARQAGLAASRALTGAELAALDGPGLALRLADTDIFCRVQPAQKLHLVQAFQARGEVVAMTGDGVNDAPALKAADIGVAMGGRGTDVAREAAALILLDDNFTSLVTAVGHGRRVFANLRKAIVFVVAAHVPIVGLSLIPVLAGWQMLLLPAHVLFLQLIIDPACSLIFEAQPAEPDAMRAPPRPASARLFDWPVLLRGLAQGAGLLLALVGVNLFARAQGAPDDAIRATTFAVLVLANLGLIYANRAFSRPSWQGGAVPDRLFAFFAAGALVLLALVLAVPLLRTFFSFRLPSVALAASGAAALLASLLWFEAVKWRAGRARDQRASSTFR